MAGRGDVEGAAPRQVVASGPVQQYTRLGMRWPLYRDWTFWLSLVLGVWVWSGTRPEQWWLAALLLPPKLLLMFTAVGAVVGWVRRGRRRRLRSGASVAELNARR